MEGKCSGVAFLFRIKETNITSRVQIGRKSPVLPLRRSMGIEESKDMMKQVSQPNESNEPIRVIPEAGSFTKESKLKDTQNFSLSHNSAISITPINPKKPKKEEVEGASEDKVSHIMPSPCPKIKSSPKTSVRCRRAKF